MPLIATRAILNYGPRFWQSGLRGKSIIIAGIAIVVLALYSISGLLFLQPRADLYVPSETWFMWLAILPVTISLAVMGWLFNDLKIAEQDNSTELSCITLVTGVFVYGLSLLLLLSLGEIITERMTTPVIKTYRITKAPVIQESKREFKVDTYAYCVSSPDFQRAFFMETYCLSQDQYDQLPDFDTTADFKVHVSFFGTVIKGYATYFPYKI